MPFRLFGKKKKILKHNETDEEKHFPAPSGNLINDEDAIAPSPSPPPLEDILCPASFKKQRTNLPSPSPTPSSEPSALPNVSPTVSSCCSFETSKSKGIFVIFLESPAFVENNCYPPVTQGQFVWLVKNKRGVKCTSPVFDIPDDSNLNLNFISFLAGVEQGQEYELTLWFQEYGQVEKNVLATCHMTIPLNNANNENGWSKSWQQVHGQYITSNVLVQIAWAPDNTPVERKIHDVEFVHPSRYQVADDMFYHLSQHANNQVLVQELDEDEDDIKSLSQEQAANLIKQSQKDFLKIHKQKLDQIEQSGILHQEEEELPVEQKGTEPLSNFTNAEVKETITTVQREDGEYKMIQKDLIVDVPKDDQLIEQLQTGEVQKKMRDSLESFSEGGAQALLNHLHGEDVKTIESKPSGLPPKHLSDSPASRPRKLDRKNLVHHSIDSICSNITNADLHIPQPDLNESNISNVTNEELHVQPKPTVQLESRTAESPPVEELSSAGGTPPDVSVMPHFEEPPDLDEHRFLADLEEGLHVATQKHSEQNPDVPQLKIVHVNDDVPFLNIEQKPKPVVPKLHLPERAFTYMTAPSYDPSKVKLPSPSSSSDFDPRSSGSVDLRLLHGSEDELQYSPSMSMSLHRSPAVFGNSVVPKASPGQLVDGRSPSAVFKGLVNSVDTVVNSVLAPSPAEKKEDSPSPVGPEMMNPHLEEASSAKKSKKCMSLSSPVAEVLEEQPPLLLPITPRELLKVDEQEVKISKRQSTDSIDFHAMCAAAGSDDVSTREPSKETSKVSAVSTKLFEKEEEEVQAIEKSLIFVSPVKSSPRSCEFVSPERNPSRSRSAARIVPVQQLVQQLDTETHNFASRFSTDADRFISWARQQHSSASPSPEQTEEHVMIEEKVTHENTVDDEIIEQPQDEIQEHDEDKPVSSPSLPKPFPIRSPPNARHGLAMTESEEKKEDKLTLDFAHQDLDKLLQDMKNLDRRSASRSPVRQVAERSPLSITPLQKFVVHEDELSPPSIHEASPSPNPSPPVFSHRDSSMQSRGRSPSTFISIPYAKPAANSKRTPKREPLTLSEEIKIPVPPIVPTNFPQSPNKLNRFAFRRNDQPIRASHELFDAASISHSRNIAFDQVSHISQRTERSQIARSGRGRNPSPCPDLTARPRVGRTSPRTNNPQIISSSLSRPPSNLNFDRRNPLSLSLSSHTPQTNPRTSRTEIFNPQLNETIDLNALDREARTSLDRAKPETARGNLVPYIGKEEKESPRPMDSPPIQVTAPKDFNRPTVIESPKLDKLNLQAVVSRSPNNKYKITLQQKDSLDACQPNSRFLSILQKSRELEQKIETPLSEVRRQAREVRRQVIAPSALSGKLNEIYYCQKSDDSVEE